MVNENLMEEMTFHNHNHSPPTPPTHTVGVQASRHLKIWEKNIPWEEKSNAEVLRWRHFDINEESKEVSGGNYKGEE